MPITEISPQRNQILRHAWIADLARYYSVTSTPDFDIVLIQTDIFHQDRPVILYASQVKKTTSIRVHDGGFCLQMLSSPPKEGRKPPLHSVRYRLRSLSVDAGFLFENGTISSMAIVENLSFVVENLSLFCARVLRSW